ncbi:MAG TPA: hypothetical protein DET40_00895 [Lentisphaeria bacterium]|nr:MAG: hypothetical protein A2X45_06280 [Lentisphaerae bacterium GWF2_50_93]HCE42089.1 hypothetical protein [Lentisphaeria bacterium]
MKSKIFLFECLVGLVLTASSAKVVCGDDFQQTCEAAAKGVPSESITYKGQDGWMYSGSELRHLASGRFFASPPKDPQTNPIPAIVDFNDQLKKLGVKLIFVPVPPKATVYPEGISSKFSPDAAYAALREFYGILKDKGVETLDLHGIFIAAKKPGQELYCRQDSHWSPYACEIAAKAIAAVILLEPWVQAIPKKQFQSENKELELTGDLWESLGDKTIPKEKILSRLITGTETIDAGSPVLLIGDSHALVFHAGGDMLAEKSGLVDQLAYEMGFPVDLLAVRGSGATSVRINLYRKSKQAGWLNHVKVIVWCLSARDFTEASGGWRKTPVESGK